METNNMITALDEVAATIKQVAETETKLINQGIHNLETAVIDDLKKQIQQSR